MNNEDPVLLHTEGRTRHITLNRPRALNALTHTMVLRVDEALTAAEQDDSVTAVLISGAGSAASAQAATSAPYTRTPARAAPHRWTSGATSTGSMPVSPAFPSRTLRSWTAS